MKAQVASSADQQPTDRTVLEESLRQETKEKAMLQVRLLECDKQAAAAESRRLMHEEMSLKLQELERQNGRLEVRLQDRDRELAAHERSRETLERASQVLERECVELRLFTFEGRNPRAAKAPTSEVSSESAQQKPLSGANIAKSSTPLSAYARRYDDSSEGRQSGSKPYQECSPLR